MTIRPLTEIVRDSLNTNANRAAECLRILDALPAEDLARDDYRAAAQTFALLSVSDALHTGPTGRPLAEVIALAGDIQL